MAQRNKIYIASDFHLGIDADLSSVEREQKIIRWLDMIQQDAQQLILNGDVFDYWFEYRSVVPRGYYRFISKLSELAELGIQITFFRGNHDMWMFDYFKKELNAQIISDPLIYEWGGKKFMVGHGDGLGKGDWVYKMVKYIFRNQICQWLFSTMHPNLGLALMKFFSKQHRDKEDGTQFDKNEERLYAYCESYIKESEIDYFIFGHRHLPIKQTLSNKKSVYYNCGDWLHHYSYIEIDSSTVHFRFFENEENTIYSS